MSSVLPLSARTPLHGNCNLLPRGLLCHRQDTSVRETTTAINLSSATCRLHDLEQASVSSSIEWE